MFSRPPEIQNLLHQSPQTLEARREGTQTFQVLSHPILTFLRHGYKRKGSSTIRKKRELQGPSKEKKQHYRLRGNVYQDILKEVTL